MQNRTECIDRASEGDATRSMHSDSMGNVGLILFPSKDGTESNYWKSSFNVLIQCESLRQRFAFELLVNAVVVMAVPLPMITELNLSILLTDCTPATTTTDDVMI